MAYSTASGPMPHFVRPVPGFHARNVPDTEGELTRHPTLFWASGTPNWHAVTWTYWEDPGLPENASLRTIPNAGVQDAIDTVPTQFIRTDDPAHWRRVAQVDPLQAWPFVHRPCRPPNSPRASPLHYHGHVDPARETSELPRAVSDARALGHDAYQCVGCCDPTNGFDVFDAVVNGQAVVVLPGSCKAGNLLSVTAAARLGLVGETPAIGTAVAFELGISGWIEPVDATLSCSLPPRCDVVLGTAWLREHKVIIDWRDHTMSYEPRRTAIPIPRAPNVPQSEFLG